MVVGGSYETISNYTKILISTSKILILGKFSRKAAKYWNHADALESLAPPDRYSQKKSMVNYIN